MTSPGSNWGLEFIERAWWLLAKYGIDGPSGIRFHIGSCYTIVAHRHLVTLDIDYRAPGQRPTLVYNMTENGGLGFIQERLPLVSKVMIAMRVDTVLDELSQL